tara:strand:- start:13 stop:228 length:216 start_codon:yes stop_codon:yes gene_type:complete
MNGNDIEFLAMHKQRIAEKIAPRQRGITRSVGRSPIHAGRTARRVVRSMLRAAGELLSRVSQRLIERAEAI